MRTTVTLDDDVVFALRALAQQRGISFKEALNSSVRRGLGTEASSEDRYHTPTFDLGVRPGVDLDKANELAADLEDDALLAKLELRK